MIKNLEIWQRNWKHDKRPENKNNQNIKLDTEVKLADNRVVAPFDNVPLI